MDDASRLAAFEKMLADIIKEQADNDEKMAALKAQGREKTVTYRQLLAKRLELINLMDRYRRHGLADRKPHTQP